MSIPSEVQAYYQNGKRKLIQITANDDYSLTLQFDNGETRLYDLKDKLAGVLSVLENKAKFAEVFIDEHGNIAWDIDTSIDSNRVYSNRIDISSDSAYIYGIS